MTASVKLIILLFFALINDGKLCPMNCLCYLDQVPKSVLCSDQSLDEFPVRISDLVEHLDLSKNELTIIADDIGRLVELKYINFSHNQLTGLPEQIGELWKLEKLDLSFNKINNVVDGIGVIARLSNLRLLYLRNNPVRSLDDLANAALRALDVSQCLISQVGNESLNGFPELISLSLDGNPLKSIRNIKGEKLKWLDLSNCRLNFLHSDTFALVPELEQLRIANNPTLVYSSRKETLKHNKLKRLDVSGCNLDRPGLHGLPSLTHAVLTRNIIRLLPNRIFAKNKLLTHLYLNYNSLTQLNGSSFVGIPQLEFLDLSNNNLEYLPFATFADNPNLRLLNLSNNDFKEFPANLLIPTIVLDLSSNLIEYIRRDSFIKLPRIKSLNLSKNRMETLDTAFEARTLKVLILEGNRLVRLSNRSFVNLPSLTGLDLSGNRLTHVSMDIFEHNLELQTILLHDNPWRCDCNEIYSTFIYLTNTKKTSSSSLICESPANVTGYSWSTVCRTNWNPSPELESKSERTYGLVLMGLLIAVLVFGSIVSIGHTIKAKRRQVALRLREAERAEARERLILLRRSQLEELQRTESTPRVHPDELIGPPTYEEAVEMPRAARSLDNLDLITDGIGQSAQSLDHDAWSRKRRKQTRKRIGNKRTRSEDDLNTRSAKNTSRSLSVPRRFAPAKAASRSLSSRNLDRQSGSEEASGTDGIRTRTPLTKKKRRWRRNDGHSSDDEDSDAHRNDTVGVRRGGGGGGNVDSVVPVVDLTREPRSGIYRPTPATAATMTPEPQVSTHISRSKIV